MSERSERRSAARTSAPPKPYQRRLDESMTLLREVMERPLDPGYAAAAARRAAGGQRDGGARRILSTGLTAVLAVLAGFGLAVAVSIVRQPADSAANVRKQLQQRIEQTETSLHRGEARNVRLRSDIAAAQQVALGSGGETLRAQERALGGATGALPVTGPGVQIVVDDAPSGDDDAVGSDPRAATDQDDGIVLDIDLQAIVNGLWGAGAEAISINGQRLTALSAIRSAGQAILVDFRPMVPPYTIQAIGNSATLQTNFASSYAGSYAQMLKQHNIRVSIDGQDKLALPAAGQLTVSVARPVQPRSAQPKSSQAKSSQAMSSQPKSTPSKGTP